MSYHPLSKHEVEELIENISKPTFEFMKKMINLELDRFRLKNKKEEVEMNFIVNLIIIALASLDTNVLIMTRGIFKKTTNKELDFVKMMDIYFKNVTSIMNQDELNRLKEKMN